MFTKIFVQITCGHGLVLLCGGVAIRYILPVLQMSRLAVMGRMAMRGRLTLNLLPLAALRYRGGV